MAGINDDVSVGIAVLSVGFTASIFGKYTSSG
jgi:hypothetical protein